MLQGLRQKFRPDVRYSTVVKTAVAPLLLLEKVLLSFLLSHFGIQFVSGILPILLCLLYCIQLIEHCLHASELDRKSTRLNSSHTVISYAVFCLKKKKKKKNHKSDKES